MSDNRFKQTAIENYIAAYNNFDVEAMLNDLHRNVRFKNVSNGEVTLTTKGIAEFREQAERAKSFFSQREQRITAINFQDDRATAEISYRGILAVDLPNGLKSGGVLELAGKSIFRFADDKIIEIEDIS